MRIASYHKFSMPSNYIQNLETQMSKRFKQLLTGKKLNKPSDDPIKVNELMLLQETQSRINQYDSNINDAKNLLEYLDVVLDTSTETLNLAKETAITGSNGTMSSADREVLANSIENNIEQLLSFANSRHLDRYVFSGEKTDTVPLTYDGNSFTYEGNSNSLSIQISPNMSVLVSQSAEDIFRPALDSLVNLRDALRAGDQELLQESMADLDQAFNDFVDNRSIIGTQLKSVELMKGAYVQTLTDIESKRTEVEGTNMVEAYSEYEQLELFYQAAVQSSISMMRLTILDYI